MEELLIFLKNRLMIMIIHKKSEKVKRICNDVEIKQRICNEIIR